MERIDNTWSISRLQQVTEESKKKVNENLCTGLILVYIKNKRGKYKVKENQNETAEEIK